MIVMVLWELSILYGSLYLDVLRTILLCPSLICTSRYIPRSLDSTVNPLKFRFGRVTCIVRPNTVLLHIGSTKKAVAKKLMAGKAVAEKWLTKLRALTLIRSFLGCDSCWSGNMIPGMPENLWNR